MTEFDYAVIGVVGLSVTLGAVRGFVREVFALASWVLAFFVTREFGPIGSQAMRSFFSEPLVQAIVGYGLVFAGTLLLCYGVVSLAQALLKAAGLGLADRALGGVFGLVRGGLIVMAAMGVASFTSLPKKDFWLDATLSKPLEVAVLSVKPWLPAELAKKIQFPIR